MNLQPMRTRVPKMLYAPPEFFTTFQHPLRETDFDELLAGDVYSMALLFWEISNKGSCYKKRVTCNTCGDVYGYIYIRG